MPLLPFAFGVVGGTPAALHYVVMRKCALTGSLVFTLLHHNLPIARKTVKRKIFFLAAGSLFFYVRFAVGWVSGI